MPMTKRSGHRSPALDESNEINDQTADAELDDLAMELIDSDGDSDDADKDTAALLDEVSEPDPGELEEIEEEEGGEDQSIESHDVAVDFTNDPVRMYLREIGRVPLLEPHQEIWLSTQREAANHLADIRARLETNDGDKPSPRQTVNALLDSLYTTWSEAVKVLTQLDCPIPDLASIVDEAQALHAQVMPDVESYLSTYLISAGAVETSEAKWARAAEHLFDAFTLLYLLPDSALETIRAGWIQGGHRLPKRQAVAVDADNRAGRVPESMRRRTEDVVRLSRRPGEAAVRRFRGENLEWLVVT